MSIKNLTLWAVNVWEFPFISDISLSITINYYYLNASLMDGDCLCIGL